jgi:hypothetical protein
VKGIHFVQEDSAAEIGAAVADFVRGRRGKRRDCQALNEGGNVEAALKGETR